MENLEAPFGKGFNCCGAKLRLRCADSRFTEPRSFLEKVLIVAVRSCGCGVLNRGLQNLETSCERDVFRAFRVYEKNQKYTRGLRTSGLRGRFKALPEVSLQKLSGGFCRNRFCLQNGGEKALNRCERIAVEQTQDCCFSKMVIVLQAHSRMSRIKIVTAR